MGNLFNSNATIVYRIINALGWIAGISCVAMIVFAIFKIMTGDEQDKSRYLRRIRNGIIAFILILSITVITNIVTKYFTPNVNAETSIGDFSKVDVDIVQGISNNYSPSGQIAMIEGNSYIKTSSDKKYDVDKSWLSSKKIVVDYYKDLSQCTGTTKGAFADIEYVYFRYQDGNSAFGGANGDNGYKDYFLPYDKLEEYRKNGKISEPDGLKDFIKTFGIHTSNVTWVDQSTANPFADGPTTTKSEIVKQDENLQKQNSETGGNKETLEENAKNLTDEQKQEINNQWNLPIYDTQN